MPYDLTRLETYLEINNPREIALLLDDLLFDLIVSMDKMGGHEELFDKYLSIVLLRNEFAQMDEELKKVWK